MPLDDAAFNSFATSLTRYFAERCKGLDDNGRRIVAARPADHILAGFLTPVRPAEAASVSPEADEFDPFGESIETDEAVITADDLPRDSSYEQTAIGLEWITPLEQLQDSMSIEVEVELCVYVRRFPTREEQDRRKAWLRHATPRQCEMIQAWTREPLRPIKVKLNAGELKRKRRLAVGAPDQVIASWDEVEKLNLYPGRRVLTILETELASPESYDAKIKALQSDRMPMAWNPVIDARLVAMPTVPGCVRVALRIINQTEKILDKYLDFVDPNLYSVRLKVKMPRALHTMAIFQELPASYRYNREMYGIGINAHVDGEEVGDDLILSIDSVPTKRVDRLEPRRIAGASPRFDVLAIDPAPVLRLILDDMRRYDAEDWARKIGSLEKDVECQDAVDARARFRDEIARFERGVRLLEDEKYPDVRKAFTLMNRAMSESARGMYDEWRLFQIVFIVSQVPALAGRQYPELQRPDDDQVDILWFAAGGGKTEGFLGLILWQIFFDRLRGKRIGVTAFVRFPLRLLAFQQLRRLARALAAAESIREQEKLGGAQFSIGDFVGSNVTPNSISNDDHSRFRSRGVDKRLQRIFECPFCDAEVRLDYDEDLRLIMHVCTNAACKGAKRLPLYIVDTDIYRFLPTVIVSTVDKIALLGYNQRFANIFGRFDLLCHRHGVSFSNKNDCPAAKAFGGGSRPDKCDGKNVEYGPFHDPAPALLIQDELHLLTEATGAFDAHYETAVMALARSLGARPWKIIAATATIEEYEQHAKQLYLKCARQFPGPGTGAYDSFYYKQNGDRIGRIFVGVLGIGRKHTPAVTRALSILYYELQVARELTESDLDAAAARYGTGKLSADEFRRLIFLYELPLTYVLTRKGSDQVAEAIESRVKGELRESSPKHGELIVDMFNGGVDFTEMAAAMQRISSTSHEGDPSKRIRGLVTTSIIGHGVDVDRFNIIVFAGFTRLVAEYIQASARVGRTYPGISIFVATPQNERDRSIFDRFAKFHEYLDRLVDPSAVTRWTEPALQRTIPGLLAGYLMGIASHRLHKPISTVEDVRDNHARVGAESLNETEIVKWMEEACGASEAPAPDKYRERVNNRLSNTYRSVINTLPYQGGRKRDLGKYLGAMMSLRDVDDPAYIRVYRPNDKIAIRRLTNG